MTDVIHRSGCRTPDAALWFQIDDAAGQGEERFSKLEWLQRPIEYASER